MPVKQTISEEVEMLLKHKGKTCISIILPLHNLTIDQKADKLHVDKMIQEVREQLRAKNTEIAEHLVASVTALRQQIKFSRKDEGIGLYISEDLSFYSTFPFTVAENILIDESFRLKELLLKEQYAVPYNLLYIDEHRIRLFSGQLRELTEIRNGEFPMTYEGSYEYQQVSHSSLLPGYMHVKSFESELNRNEKIKHESFIQQANDQLHKYFQNSEVLLLCGVTKYTSAFLNRTSFGNRIIGVLNGTYNRYDENDFSKMVWPSIDALVYERIIDEIGEYNEKIGEGLAEKGIVPVWDAVLSGRGQTLLVERNYQVKGFLTNDSSWQLFLQAPRRKHKVLQDAINDLIEMLLQKNGNVVFTEDGMLNQHQHIALITRYSYFA